MAIFTREGYGQVEPNHLSYQVTGQMSASLPLASDIAVLQNGEFMKYDIAAKEVNGTGIGEWMMVFNEVKTYYEGSQDKDFAMIVQKNGYITENARMSVKSNSAIGSGVNAPYQLIGCVPRLVKINVGDWYTSNMVKSGVEYTLGEVLVPVLNTTTKTAVLEEGVGDFELTVVQIYTMPDGQPGLKLMRTK